MKIKYIILLAILSLFPYAMIRADEELQSYRLSITNGLPNNNIRNLYLGKTGIIYFKAEYATYAFDGYTFRQVDLSKCKADFENYMLTKNPKGNTYKGWNQDNLGNYFKVSDDGFIHITDSKTKQNFTLKVFDTKLLQLSKNIRVCVVTDIRGLIWISVSGNGLFLYNKQTNQLRHITKESDAALIDSNYIIALMSDKCGNIWVSQEHMGVVCLKVSPKKYRTVSINNDSYQTRNIRMIKRLSNGNIYICNNAGESYITDGLLNNIRCTMKGKNILTAIIDSNKRQILGSRQDGICIDGKWTCQGRIESIVEDDKGRIWACGLHNGLYVAEKGSTKFRRLIPDLGQRQIAINRKTGDFLVAADSGLISFNPEKLLRNNNDYNIIAKTLCRCVYVRYNGDIWIGTPNNGILVKRNNNNKLERFTHNDGLPINAITFITEIPLNATKTGMDRIMVGTENGAVIYDGKHFNRLYTSNNSLTNFCQENACAILDNGNIAIGTLDGIVIAENSLPSSTSASIKKPLSVSDIIANGVSAITEDNVSLTTDNQKHLTLGHDTDNMTFYFSTHDYTDKGIVDFSYILEGYDSKWSPATTANIAQYKNLNPGHYRFRVRYRDINGKWIESAEPYDITITPAWWATWWAYVAYFIIVSTIVIVVYRQIANTQRLKRNLYMEKELTEHKIRFFTNVSHEFRTPLTLIHDSMQRIKALSDIPANLRQPLGNMQRDVERMMRLINQLLEFRKMQNNKLSLALQNTDIVALLHNIWISFYETAENKDIAYTFVPQTKSLMAFVDRNYLDKIVYNLLSNAFKYTPKGGSIMLKLSTNTNKINISVTDTGIGISKEEQAKIFDRYSTGKVNTNSVGIGLHLTQELVKVHHGEIHLHENEPKGSIFTISLPLGTEQYSESDFMKNVPELESNDNVEKRGFEVAFSEITTAPMNDKTILVVDDTPEIIDMINKELGRFFNIETSANGQEALEMLRANDGKAHNIDLVISDVKMPVMDGFELTRRIRNDKNLDTLPIILLTSLTDDSKQIQSLELGADAYITKPFSMTKLVSQCAMLLKMRSMLQNAYSAKNGTNATSKEAVKAIIKEEKDMKFVKQLEQAVSSRLADLSLDVDSLSVVFGMGRTSFYHKVKSLTGKTPNEYISDMRLDVAATLLKESNLQVGEVAARTGYSSPQYLARNFKKKFGMSPSEYAGK